jgi:hypothetical protein
MKLFRDQKILLTAVILIVSLSIVYAFRSELNTLYNKYKYSRQVNDAKNYLITVAKKESPNNKKLFTKDSYFLSNPIYFEQLQECLSEKDTKSFRPVFIYKSSEDNHVVLYIRLMNNDKYPVNFKFIRISNFWLIASLHLDP